MDHPFTRSRHLSNNRRDYGLVNLAAPRYFVGMLEQYISQTPLSYAVDDEFEDLLKSAYLAGLITGETQDLHIAG